MDVGTWWLRKRAVEECPVLRVAAGARLIRKGRAELGVFLSQASAHELWMSAWQQDDGLWLAELEWCGKRGMPRRQVVRFARSFPRLGGVRWWWECPGLPWNRWETPRDEDQCGKPVGALYLRSGRWACRGCHGLTYRSCRGGKRSEK